MVRFRDAAFQTITTVEQIVIELMSLFLGRKLIVAARVEVGAEIDIQTAVVHGKTFRVVLPKVANRYRAARAIGNDRLNIPIGTRRFFPVDDRN